MANTPWVSSIAISFFRAAARRGDEGAVVGAPARAHLVGSSGPYCGFPRAVCMRQEDDPRPDRTDPERAERGHAFANRACPPIWANTFLFSVLRAPLVRASRKPQAASQREPPCVLARSSLQYYTTLQQS